MDGGRKGEMKGRKGKVGGRKLFVVLFCVNLICCYLRTKFTGVERYSYIDPDFALTDEEEKRKEDHKNLYLDYIRDCRAFREMKTKKRFSIYTVSL